MNSLITTIENSNFQLCYQKWYTESLEVIKQIIPNRKKDFIKLYKAKETRQDDKILKSS